MAYLHRVLLIAILAVTTCGARTVRANEPPVDLCSLLPAVEVSKILGRTYEAPQKSVAPRPYANTAEGTDCNYYAGRNRVWFRAYVDPSPAAATELFAKLSKFYAPSTPVAGLGDEAYLDREHAIHVRKGKVRFYINLDPMNFSPVVEKQIKDLATRVVGQL